MIDLTDIKWVVGFVKIELNNAPNSNPLNSVLILLRIHKELHRKQKALKSDAILFFIDLFSMKFNQMFIVL